MILSYLRCSAFNQNTTKNKQKNNTLLKGSKCRYDPDVGTVEKVIYNNYNEHFKGSSGKLDNIHRQKGDFSLKIETMRKKNQMKELLEMKNHNNRDEEFLGQTYH